MNHRLYLTRRNLEALLSKLDRVKRGEQSFCTIVKGDCEHPKYPQTMPVCIVTAVENEDYYYERLPGEMHPSDAPKVEAPMLAILVVTGIVGTVWYVWHESRSWSSGTSW